MPTLTPEHVLLHLPDVSFVCRGAGEYFVPALCRILGDGDIDTPLSATQRAKLLQLDGLLAYDRAGKTLLRANDARAVSVESLDRIPLDLEHLQARHLDHGVEISTSRGCTHRCAFCTIVGQAFYQARSADGVFDLLGRYQARFEALFGAEIPDRVYRLHINDDDFGCDPARAIAFFDGLTDTPFRLASCQMSVADFLTPDGPDRALIGAIRPECFADHGRNIARSTHVLDYHSRRWSAYLQFGVESFSDAELRRHAKGYTVADVRAVVSALASNGIHVDAYLILSNVHTSASDLIASLTEIVRLKLRHPVHFHVRYPVTPRLVSVFPSASYRRHARRGELDALRLSRTASVPGYPEYDYPFVLHDVPRDARVEAAVARDFFTDERRYGGSLEALRQIWRGVPDATDLVRELDGLFEHLVFEWLSEDPNAAAASALELLGEKERWMPAYRAWRRRRTLTITVAEGANGAVQSGVDSLRRTARRTTVSATGDGPELRVDTDGGIYSGGRCLGHLDDGHNLERYAVLSAP